MIDNSNAKYLIENSNVHKKMSTNYYVFDMFNCKSFMIEFTEMNMKIITYVN